MARQNRKQLIERGERAHKRKLFEAQEAQRAPRIMPDTRFSQYLTFGLGGIIILTSFIYSYAALMKVAEWTRPEWGWLVAVLPGFIEVIILFGTVGFVVASSRGEKTSAYLQIGMVGFATIVAIAANAAHTLSAWQADGSVPWEGWFGVGIAALAPVAVAYITKSLATLVFAQPIVLDDN